MFMEGGSYARLSGQRGTGLWANIVCMKIVFLWCGDCYRSDILLIAGRTANISSEKSNAFRKK